MQGRDLTNALRWATTGFSGSEPEEPPQDREAHAGRDARPPHRRRGRRLRRAAVPDVLMGLFVHVTLLTAFQNRLTAVSSWILALSATLRSRVFTPADLSKPASTPAEPRRALAAYLTTEEEWK